MIPIPPATPKVINNTPIAGAKLINPLPKPTIILSRNLPVSIPVFSISVYSKSGLNSFTKDKINNQLVTKEDIEYLIFDLNIFATSISEYDFLLAIL